MGRWVAARRVEELAPGRRRVADVGDARFVAFNLDGHRDSAVLHLHRIQNLVSVPTRASTISLRPDQQ